jgi:hypothetical protein
MKLCKMERSTIKCSQALRRTSSASREFCQVRGVREVRPHSEVRMHGPSLVFEMLTGPAEWCLREVSPIKLGAA